MQTFTAIDPGFNRSASSGASLSADSSAPANPPTFRLSGHSETIDGTTPNHNLRYSGPPAVTPAPYTRSSQPQRPQVHFPIPQNPDTVSQRDAALDPSPVSPFHVRYPWSSYPTSQPGPLESDRIQAVDLAERGARLKEEQYTIDHGAINSGSGSQKGGGSPPWFSMPSTGAGLAKLQTIMPTGTFVTFTALQTWALSSATSDNSCTNSCSTSQKVSLSILLAFGFILSFVSAFIKSYVTSEDSKTILYPPPHAFEVPYAVKDPVTGWVFPAKTKGGRVVYPKQDRNGSWVYDENRERVRIYVFKRGFQVTAKDRRILKKVQSVVDQRLNRRRSLPTITILESTRGRASGFPNANQAEGEGVYAPLRDSMGSTYNSTAIDIDEILDGVPALKARYQWILPISSNKYLDFGKDVWYHALVSFLLFGNLTLLSTQVYKCLYPSIPSFLPGLLQTVFLAGFSFVAAYIINDDSISVGQPHQPNLLRVLSRPNEIPPELTFVVDGAVWVGKRVTKEQEDDTDSSFIDHDHDGDGNENLGNENQRLYETSPEVRRSGEGHDHEDGVEDSDHELRDEGDWHGGEDEGRHDFEPDSWRRRRQWTLPLEKIHEELDDVAGSGTLRRTGPGGKGDTPDRPSPSTPSGSPTLRSRPTVRFPAPITTSSVPASGWRNSVGSVPDTPESPAPTAEDEKNGAGGDEEKMGMLEKS